MRSTNFFNFLILLFLIYSGGSSKAQELFPIYSSEGCGLIDENGAVVVEAINDQCAYDNKLRSGIIKSKQGWNVINGSGEFLSTQYYDSVWQHQSNYLAIKQGKYSLLIIEKSRLKLEILADSVSPFFFNDRVYQMIYEPQKVYLTDEEGTSYLKHLNLKKITVLDQKHLQVFSGDKTGIVDLSGEPYLPIEYDSLKYYDKGILFYKDGKLGYKRTLPYISNNTKKHEVIYFPPKYTTIRYFGDRFMRLQQKDRIILYDLHDKYVVNDDFNHRALPFDNYFHIYREGRKYGLMDLTGKILSDSTYTRLYSSGHSNRVIFQLYNKFGLLDENGVQLTGAEFDQLYPFEGVDIHPRVFTKYKLNTMLGLININGDTLTGPDYIQIRLIADDRAACVKPDSSVQVFEIDINSASIKDWYDLAHVKLLAVNKKIVSKGTENLKAELIPGSYGNLYAKTIVNYGKTGKVRYDQNNYYELYEKQIGDVRIFYRHKLNDYSMAPEDVYQSIMCVNYGVWTAESDWYIRQSTRDYTNIRLIRNKFFIATQDDGEIDFLNLRLDKLTYKLKPNPQSVEQTYTVRNYIPGNHYYPHIFQATRNLKDNIYLLPRSDFKSFYTPPIYDSIVLLDSIIYGRVYTTWSVASEDSTVRLPINTRSINTSPEVVICTHYKPTYYIYDSNGKLSGPTEKLHIIAENEKVALVKKDSTYNFLLPSGKFLLKEDVRYATMFQNGYASIQKDELFYIIDESGKITNPEGQNKSVKINEAGVGVYRDKRKCGLMNTEGTIVDSARYALVKPIAKSTFFAYKYNRSGSMGIMSSTGEKFGETYYKRISYLGDSTFLCSTNKGKGLFSVATNNEILKPKFMQIRNANDGFYKVSKKGKWGMVNSEGNWILKPKYFKVSSFNEFGSATVTSKDGTEYLLKDGTLLSKKPEYKLQVKPTEDIREKMIIDGNGDYIGVPEKNIPVQYHKIRKLKNGAVLAERSFQFSIINKSGELLINSDQWLTVEPIGTNVLKIKTTESTRYFNTTTLNWIN